MAQHRQRRGPMAEINVVPYIDVMLVLLVIFMITAPLLSQGVKVDLPQADAKPLDKESREPVEVSVDAEGSFYINIGGDEKVPVEAEEIVKRVSIILRKHPDTPVVVRGDNNVNYGAVVEAMVLLQRAGAPGVGLATDPVERK
ncbi:protein TolR [Candidatus Tenderia electrophaga]|jgi:biopolymer transport protein TolR|uniref:Tol-Pal system protein TolR n=1 Tax=Candidatus Tenderia electrophaga TaxID=1748243 RepID=A0A0S2TFS6_9GAMM|nr:protein TolR [Candidatus Tenderia electrophaga]